MLNLDFPREVMSSTRAAEPFMNSSIYALEYL